MKIYIFVSIILISVCDTLCAANKEKGQSSYDTLDRICSDMRKELDSILQASKDKTNGYIGCFQDKSRRHLGHKMKQIGKTMTLAKCRAHCIGYKYLGLQGQEWCLCGNQLYKEGYAFLPDSKCNMPCIPEPDRQCGGSMINSIYYV